jgi:hypothetical protein
VYARVVRFTGVDSDDINRVKAQVEASEGPPPGVDSNAMKLLHDSSQGTAIFVAFFETEEAMNAADQVFRDMDAGDTPGDRQSIDQCEVVIEREAGDRG